MIFTFFHSFPTNVIPVLSSHKYPRDVKKQIQEKISGFAKSI